MYDGPPVLLSPGERLHEGISQAQLEHHVVRPPVGGVTRRGNAKNRKPKEVVHSGVTTEGR